MISESTIDDWISTGRGILSLAGLFAAFFLFLNLGTIIEKLWNVLS